ncbi:D-alanyl-D-alanine carboxypeptidase family protein [Thermoflavimicrobium daqui]|nr:D-alanyl-D-alanine carboxypeptidase family protein [Thermoflavimicrobium daqui]
MYLRIKMKWMTSCLFSLLLIWVIPSSIRAEEKESFLPQLQAKSFVLMDATTGKVLISKNADQSLPPASMTKMMSELLVLDAIQSGKLKWTDKVKMSSRVESVDESQMYLLAGEEETVRELFIGMAVRSANDATVALAEKVAGSEERFVAQMNQKAKKIGMKHTHFYATTGLEKSDYKYPPKTSGNHVMSAYDSALLARYLIKEHPEVLKITSLPRYIFRKGTPRELQSNSTNRMLIGLRNYYQGVDGIKTGYTDQAMFCFTGTAKRNGMRLITVVMGAPTADLSFQETAKLLDYGFTNYQIKTLIKGRKSLPNYPSVPVEDGVKESVSVVTKKDIILPIRKGEESKYTYQVSLPKKIEAPKKKGAVIGKIEVIYAGKKVGNKTDLVVAEEVEKLSWFKQLFRDITAKFTAIF